MRLFVVCETHTRSSAVDPAQTGPRGPLAGLSRAWQARIPHGRGMELWPWSERGQVGASAAQKAKGWFGSARLQTQSRLVHRVPEGDPKEGGIAVINMLDPAFASLSLSHLRWPALALRSQTLFSPCAGRWGKAVTCQRTSCWYSDRDRGSIEELLRCWRAARRCSSSRRGCQPTCRGAVGSLPPAEAKDRCTRACRCW